MTWTSPIDKLVPKNKYYPYLEVTVLLKLSASELELFPRSLLIDIADCTIQRLPMIEESYF